MENKVIEDNIKICKRVSESCLALSSLINKYIEKEEGFAKGGYVPNDLADAAGVVHKSDRDIMKEKFESGDYIWVHNFPTYRNEWQICGKHGDYTQCKPIHKKHKDILDAYLKDNSVEIEYEYPVEHKIQWHNLNCDWLSIYDETINYRLKPKEEYPMFRVSDDDEVFQLTQDGAIIVFSKYENRIGATFSVTTTELIKHLKTIPYNKERGLYHKQPIWVKYYDTFNLGIWVDFFDIDATYNMELVEYIEPITPEQLKVMPFIFELREKLKDEK